MLKRGRVRDVSAYIGISLAVISVMIACFSAGFDWQTFVKWFGFTAATLVLSSIVWTGAEAKLRNNRYYWKVNVGALLVHCFAWVALLIAVHEWKFIWFSPMIVEIALLLPLRRALIVRLSQSNEHGLV